MCRYIQCITLFELFVNIPMNKKCHKIKKNRNLWFNFPQYAALEHHKLSFWNMIEHQYEKHHHKMEESHNNCVGSKKCSTTLSQVKSGKHGKPVSIKKIWNCNLKCHRHAVQSFIQVFKKYACVKVDLATGMNIAQAAILYLIFFYYVTKDLYL